MEIDPTANENNSFGCDQVYDPCREFHHLGVKQGELVNRLYRDLISKDKAIRQLQTKADDQARLCDDTSKTNLNDTKLQLELDGARKASQDKDRDIKNLQNDKMRLENEVSNFKVSHQKKEEHIATLKDDNARLLRQIRDGNEAFKVANQKHNITKQQNEMLEKNVAGMKCEVVHGEKLLGDLQVKFREHQRNTGDWSRRESNRRQDIRDNDHYSPKKYSVSARSGRYQTSQGMEHDNRPRNPQQRLSYGATQRSADKRPDRQLAAGSQVQSSITRHSAQREKASSTIAPTMLPKEDSRFTRENTTPDNAKLHHSQSRSNIDASRDPRLRRLNNAIAQTQPADESKSDQAFIRSEQKRRVEDYATENNVKKMKQ